MPLKWDSSIHSAFRTSCLLLSFSLLGPFCLNFIYYLEKGPMPKPQDGSWLSPNPRAAVSAWGSHPTATFCFYLYWKKRK